MLSKLETKGAESALFFRHWLRHPLEIGAFLPSSAAVGRAMAKAVAFDRPGMILGAAHRRRTRACARATEGILEERGITRLAVIVSSLPIKWFPIPGQRSVIAPCLDRAGEDGSFVQLTNALVSPVAMNALHLEGGEIARVWAQFPPVQIWAYRRRRGVA